MFILLIIALIVIALFLVNLPLLKHSVPNEDSLTDDREAQNLEATRQQIKDIEKDVEYDLIADDQLSAIRTEAEDTLFLEMQARGEPVHAHKSVRFQRLTALVLSLFIPAFALLIYLSVGNPGALVETVTEESQPSMEQLISKLEQRLADNPRDEEGWLVLAQTNMMMQRFDQAASAMEKLYQLNSESPDVLARYADTLTMANNGRFTSKANQLIEKALSLDPSHVHGLWLAGVQAFQAENFDLAIKLFQKAKMNISDPENLVQIDELIKSAQEKGGDKSGEKVDVENSPPSVTIKVKVALSEKLRQSVNADQTLFVFAKAANGPPMPLAVAKLRASELPIEVSLDDSMAMMPDLKLSAFDQVIISARISNSDNPQAQSGDLQGESAVINPKDIDEINISINQVID